MNIMFNLAQLCDNCSTLKIGRFLFALQEIWHQAM